MGAIRKLRMLANEIDWHVYDNGGIPHDMRKIADEMEAENFKLRKLVRDVWDAALHPETFGDGSHLLRRMRDLGIEVE